MSQHRHEMLMEKIGAQSKGFKEAREYGDAGFQFTRRIISLVAVVSIVAVPILAGIFLPWLPISYGYTDGSALQWTTGTGIILGPIHTHLMYAIAGMYFGASSTK